MKTIRYIITLVAFALLGVIASAEEAKSTEPVKQAVSDEFMRFALDKAKQYTGTAEQVVGKTVDLVQKEAPETVEQFLKWRFFQHMAYFLIPVSATILCTAAFLFCWWAKIKWDDNWGIGIPIFGAFGFFAIMFSLCEIGDLLKAIQIYVAPRIYLIEELGKLLK